MVLYKQSNRPDHVHAKLLKFTVLVGNDTTLHGVHADTVLSSPTVLVKCSVCSYPHSLTRTPPQWLKNDPRQIVINNHHTQQTNLTSGPLSLLRCAGTWRGSGAQTRGQWVARGALARRLLNGALPDTQVATSAMQDPLFCGTPVCRPEEYDEGTGARVRRLRSSMW